jgi:uncharacterized protein (DUF433 family)
VATRSRGIRLPEQLDSELESERRFRGGTSFSQLATSLLTEAIRMRRIPGVIFVDGLDSRRAAVAGTGLEVWELIATYRAVGEHAEELAHSYPQLSESQLRSALAYYELYPEEIDARLDREKGWTPEEVWNRYPFTRPGALNGRVPGPDGSV